MAGGCVRVLVPLTVEERIVLRHKALDQRCPVGVIVRQALGLSADAPTREPRDKTM
ncbi:MAG TPA: hypothetical protein VGK30_03855 [Candidatus Binatia bacterium]